MIPQPDLDPSCPATLDRTRYHLRILADTAEGLNGLRHPHRILELFLLSAQGGVGARGGFAALLSERPEDFHLVVSPRNERPGLTAETLIRALRQVPEAGKAPFFVPCQPDNPLFAQCAAMLVCPLDEIRYGLLGLETSLRGNTYDEEDLQLLNGLAILFQTSLRFALSGTRIELLNAELEKRNAALDRQVFRLNALRELAQDISRTDMADVADNLLLTILGHFSRPQGLLLIQDRTTDLVISRIKGVDNPSEITPPEVDRLFFLCLSGLRDKHLQPQQVEPVATLPDVAELPVGFLPRSAFLFMLREHLYGVILLGPSLEPDRPDEDEHLLSFLTQAVLLLKNADSFATIRALNTNLARQNDELRRTIDELTRARDHISMLETARRRITGIVHRRSLELTRMRWLDFVLIIGLSLGMGFIYNQQSPWGIPLVEPPGPVVPTISVTEAQRLVSAENALLIDARPHEFYARSHTPGAVNIPAQLFDLVYMMQLTAEDPERPVIVYGRSISRHYDSIVAARLLNRDHERVLIVDGDMPLTPATDTP